MPDHLTRRNFLQKSCLTAASLAFAGLIPACSGLKVQTLPNIDYAKGLNLRNCNIVDVKTGKIIKNVTIMIRNQMIVRITKHKPYHSYDTTEIDIQNQYVLPGLIDAHCHTTMPSAMKYSLTRLMTNYRQIQRNFVQQIQSGVTTVRDMGALPLVLKNMLEKVNNGQFPGPRVKYCNAITNAYGGHPDIFLKDISLLAPYLTWMTGKSNLWYTGTRDLVEKFKKNVVGASFVKLTMDEQSIFCGKNRIPSYEQEDLRIIFRLAKQNNIPVAGHILTKYGFDRALHHGIHSMEHTIGDATLSAREIQLMAHKKCAIVPTMIMAQIFSAEEAMTELPDQYRTDFIMNELKNRRNYIYAAHNNFVEPEIHQDNQKTLTLFQQYSCREMYQKGIIQSNPELFFGALRYGPNHLKQMHDAGVLIGCGTDAGVPFIYPGMMFLELELLSRIGFANEDVIRFATINNAKILRMENSIGSIEQEKLADLVIVHDNPLIHLKTIRKPKIVIKDGQVAYYQKNQLKLLTQNSS
ncbi:MAG: Amidohydrolase [Candidatus Magnetoglobus multicellularis str. Araruama]|uniref:Amidohydrolase n=1 Tax=Candidatus Magnetoglobus multicellularis str. Araruama TaxID=890399 RepID=A0A1V1PCX4_9BACT|nr:MAG: Amidohydrolase [Candidatus Magnetoglobus multicellularis str. Araruama]